MREGKLNQVSHEVYVTPDTFEDEMYMLQMKSPKVVFSHETALFLVIQILNVGILMGLLKVTLEKKGLIE